MIKTIILDLDGTLYLGKKGIPGAEEKLEELRAQGINLIFFTNGSTRTRAGVVEKLTKRGIKVTKENVYCTSYFIAKFIEKNHPDSKAFIIGEYGLKEELEGVGVEIVDEGADLVVVGLDREFSYAKLKQALQELRKGARLLASNNDPYYPVEDGFVPGAGAVLAAVEKAAMMEPEMIAGKPNTYAFEVIKEEKGIKAEETLVVGDRLDTDIAFAKNCGIRSALVLTGVAKEEDITEIKPDFVLKSIADLIIHDIS